MLNTKKIGNKIAEARKKINISQAQLAERLFISSQAVGKWERGESMPDIITFNRLGEILGVDLNYFSEDIQSGTTEKAPVGSMVGHKTELQSKPDLSNGGTGKKLGWDMSHGNWVDADFSGLKGLYEKFSSSNMRHCLFIGSDLSKIQLKSNYVDSCDFSNSNIINGRLKNSSLVNSIFKECSLKEAEFSRCDIKSCNFHKANLTGVEFKSGTFANNKVKDTVWHRTSFIGMQIDDIVFESMIDDCYFENCIFKKVTFRNVTLINTFFKNKSLKRIQFVDCHVDRMTYEFLKNGKADLTGITLLE